MSLLYGWPEIAKSLNVSVITAQRWAKNYELPVAKFPNGKVFLPEQAIYKWGLKLSQMTEKGKGRKKPPKTQEAFNELAVKKAAKEAVSSS